MTGHFLARFSFQRWKPRANTARHAKDTKHCPTPRTTAEEYLVQCARRPRTLARARTSHRDVARRARAASADPRPPDCGRGSRRRRAREGGACDCRSKGTASWKASRPWGRTLAARRHRKDHAGRALPALDGRRSAQGDAEGRPGKGVGRQRQRPHLFRARAGTACQDPPVCRKPRRPRSRAQIPTVWSVLQVNAPPYVGVVAASGSVRLLPRLRRQLPTQYGLLARALLSVELRPGGMSARGVRRLLRRHLLSGWRGMSRRDVLPQPRLPVVLTERSWRSVRCSPATVA